jgi:hypothetical protein
MRFLDFFKKFKTKLFKKHDEHEDCYTQSYFSLPKDFK